MDIIREEQIKTHIFQVEEGSEEFIEIEERVNQAGGNDLGLKVEKIERWQNYMRWEKYKQEKVLMKETIEDPEQQLFYIWRTQLPDEVWDDEQDGFNTGINERQSLIENDAQKRFFDWRANFFTDDIKYITEVCSPPEVDGKK